MKLLIDIPEYIYEHAKESSEDSRDEFDAMRAIANGTQQESRSENPNTCGDAISRQSAISLASDLKQDLPDDERIADMVMAHNEGILEYQTQLSLLPSVTPQPIECEERKSGNCPFYANGGGGRMTVEEALKILDTIPTISEQVDALEMAIQALEQTRWIPVSERLPEDGEEVLCFLESEEMAVLFRRNNWGQYEWVDGGFATGSYDVIAWMPLPQPYKAESEVKE